MLNVKKFRKFIVLILLTLVMVSPVFTQLAFAFTSQGIVTGRMYADLASTSNPVLQEFQDMKLGWIRIEFEEFYAVPSGATFASVEVQANKVKFQNVINNAHAKGLKVLGVIAYSSFPATPDFPNTDAGIKTYVDAVQWHLQNYNIDAIEIWNEPGINACFLDREDSTNNLNRYAKTLIDCYALKPSYPNVTFVGAATSNAETGTWLGIRSNSTNYEWSIFNCDFMINYRASNGGNLPMDVVSWHAYGSGGAPDTTAFYFGIADFNTYYENIKAYTDRTGRNVIGNYPIWFTEYGWSSNNVTEENQRIYTEKMINMIYQKPQIQVPFLYNYSDDGVGGEGNACGIKTVTGAMKRVYYPFVAHNSLVGLFTSDGINEWTIDEIINQYYANGARGAFGDAFKSSGAPDYGDKAHYWGPNNNGCIQEFNYGGYGLCAILSKFGTSVAFTVRGAFYNYYVTNGGPYTYGWPTSNEYQSVGTTYQNFEFGKTMIVGSTVQWIPN